MLLFHPLVTPALSPWPQGGWTPWAPARLAMELPRYSPIDYVDKLKTPTLFVSALEVCDDVQLKQQAMLSTPLCPHHIPVFSLHFLLLTGTCTHGATSPVRTPALTLPARIAWKLWSGVLL